MRLVLETSGDWVIETAGWSSGALRIDIDDDARPLPSAASWSTLLTRDGWTLSLVEFTDAETLYIIAKIDLAGETAALRAHGPTTQIASTRSRLLQALQTARPSWPDTMLLSELLALPMPDADSA